MDFLTCGCRLAIPRLSHELIQVLKLAIICEVSLDVHNGEHLIRRDEEQRNMQHKFPGEVVVLLVAFDWPKHDFVSYRDVFAS